MRLKKILAFALAGSMVFAITACGGGEESNATTAEKTTGNTVVDDATSAEDEYASEKEDITTSKEKDTSNSENVMNWKIEDRTLHISGNGTMIVEIPEERDENWSVEEAQPWGSQWDDIEKIVIEDGITVVQSYSFYRDDELLRVDDYLLQVDMASSVKTIGHYAFALQTELRTVNFSENIEYIGQGAFYSCWLIKTLKLPANLKQIETEAFYLCQSVEEVEFPDGLEKIGARAFDGCYALESVYIPESVMEIGEDAFDKTHLKTIYGKAGSAAERYAKNNEIAFVEQ